LVRLGGLDFFDGDGDGDGGFGGVDTKRTVMLSPRGRMLRLLPLKVVWRDSSLDSLDEGVGAPSTAVAAVQSVRRVWAKCIFC
jgi:hypothetical protein